MCSAQTVDGNQVTIVKIDHWRPFHLLRAGMRKRSSQAAIGALLLGLVVASCGGDSDNGALGAAALTSAMVLQPGPAGVGVTTMLFEDTSRPTMPNGSFPGAQSRTLVTEIWYPSDAAPESAQQEARDAPLARNGRPFPLIMYSHGFMSMRTGGAFLARHLSSYGYVVAAPDFPLTNSHAPGGPNVFDVAEQPGDVRFLIDQLLALSAGSQGLLSGSLDPQRIGLTGLSLGGMTTYLAAFHPTLRDTRVRAAAPIAGPGCFFGPQFFGDRSVSLLILHGDIDAIVPYQQNAVFAFREANPPKYLATVVGGTHTAFADGTEFFDNQNNPDDVGCAALRGTLPEGSDHSLLDRLGGPDAGIIMGDCPNPCSGPGHGPTSIRPTRQHELTILSVAPFFEATLRGDGRARHFLEQTAAAENPDLRIERQ
jgi:predicted dienelactone hydrolase